MLVTGKGRCQRYSDTELGENGINDAIGGMKIGQQIGNLNVGNKGKGQEGF